MMENDDESGNLGAPCFWTILCMAGILGIHFPFLKRSTAQLLGWKLRHPDDGLAFQSAWH